MKSKKEKIIHLLDKSHWSKEERKWMLQYLEENSPDDIDLKILMKDRFLNDIDLESHHDIETSKVHLQHIYKRIGITIEHKPINKSLLYRLRRIRVAGVAAIIGLVIFSAYLFSNEDLEDAVLVGQAYDVDDDVITWGKKATLRLADGRTISLDDISNGEVVKQGGVMIRKTAEGKISYEIDADTNVESEKSILNTIATPRGGEYQVVLPDGSVVWLNAASSLTYPIQFPGNNRMVKVDGEAYFEVAKDANRPFIVNANEVEIKVLGTHFNVSAYSNESVIKTTLLEGSVHVKRSSFYQAPVIIKPGYQAIVANDQSPIRVVEVDTDDVMAWRNGYFIFYREDIHSVMNKVGRWYDLDIVFEGNLENRRFEGTISRMENLNSLIKALELTGIANFRLEGRRLIVKE